MFYWVQCSEGSNPNPIISQLTQSRNGEWPSMVQQPSATDCHWNKHMVTDTVKWHPHPLTCPQTASKWVSKKYIVCAQRRHHHSLLVVWRWPRQRSIGLQLLNKHCYRLADSQLQCYSGKGLVLIVKISTTGWGALSRTGTALQAAAFNSPTILMHAD